ncbi:MAG TPA: biopolymer transporter ExbD [Synergistetes bacterium]|nr:biopolymer transporter ExbD [Synergistota bacterium]
MNRARRTRALPDVELTPLIDVLFMLIIFFVLTAVFSESSIQVRLPAAQGDPSREEVFTLTVDREGLVYAGDEILPLEQAVERSLEAWRRGRKIVIAADREVEYGIVVSLLDQIRDRGVDSASLLVEASK